MTLDGWLRGYRTAQSLRHLPRTIRLVEHAAGDAVDEIRAGANAVEPLIAKPHLIAALDAGDDIEEAGGVDAASHERRLRHERAERGGRADPSDFLEDDPLDRLPRVRPRLDPIGDERLAVFTTNANHRAHAAYSHRTLSSMRVNARATKRAASPGCTIHGSTPRACDDSSKYTIPGRFCEKIETLRPAQRFPARKRHRRGRGHTASSFRSTNGRMPPERN